MALVTKNDVTQIFAIQAPEVDLPPTFANYPRGWDTARLNNGKPTIRQFNYIQQRTDQNMLWIHQNGAALPYDAAMEYAEGAVVVKDGVLQKKVGLAWVKVVESASTTQAGIVQLVNDLITGGTDKALTAEQGKLLNTAKANIADFIALKQLNGYVQIPTSGGGSVLIQWATVVTTSGSFTRWTFPIAFPTGAIAFFGTADGNAANSIAPIVDSTSANTTGVDVGAVSNTNQFIQYGVFFLAIGH